jgi:hypothetical protein
MYSMYTAQFNEKDNTVTRTGGGGRSDHDHNAQLYISGYENGALYWMWW